jgi:hypothetical protein
MKKIKKMSARNPDATAVVPMGSTVREQVYLRQTGASVLTPAQRRRWAHKNRRALRVG